MSESPIEAIEAAFAARAGSDSLPRFALGISGGSDSMALLAAVAELRERGTDWPEVWILHVDHGLRPESALDAEEVLRIARDHDFAVDFRRIERHPPAQGSLEAWAREHRYALIVEMMRARRLDVLLTAHHREDQAETVGLSLMRGAGILGLGGMPEERPLGPFGHRLRRPFLHLSRGTLTRYREERGFPEILDRSNRTLAHRRNLLRHVGILPEGGLDQESLLQFSERVRRLRDRFDRYRESFLQGGSLVVEKAFARRSAEVDAEEFATLPRELQRHILVRLLETLASPEVLPSFAAIEDLLSRSGAVELSRKSWMILAKERLRVWTEDADRRFEANPVSIDGPALDLPDWGRLEVQTVVAGEAPGSGWCQDIPAACF